MCSFSVSKPLRTAAISALLVAASPLFAADATNPQSFEHKWLVKDLRVTQPASTATQPPAAAPAPAPAPVLTPGADLSVTALGWSVTSSPTDVGSSSTQSFSVLNTGNTTLTVSSVQLRSVSPIFDVTHNCPASLAVGGSCEVRVAFLPTAAQTYTNTVDVQTSAGLRSASLSGIGLQALAAFTPSTIAYFGTTALGSSSTLTITVTSSGTKPIAGAYLESSSPRVTLESNTCGTQAAPATLAAGGSCTATARYAPTDPVDMTGTLTFKTATTMYATRTMQGSYTYPPSSLSLLLHADTSPSVDSGSKALAVALQSGASITSDAKFGTGAFSFAGGGQSATVAAGSLNFGTADFTIEGWFKIGANATATAGRNWATLLGTSEANVPQGLEFAFLSNANGAAIANNGWYFNIGGTQVVSNGAALTRGVWYHFAVAREAGTVRVFLNGTLQGSASTPAAARSVGNAPVVLGAFLATIPSYSAYYTGQLDEVRFTSGYARYKTAFTPPTAAFQ